jgi:hypothetical protein
MGDALATSFDELEGAGFQVEFLSHAYAILTHDFAEAQEQLCAALSTLTIPIEEIIAGGGGEAKGTQRLRRALAELGWEKTEFVVKKIINGKEREAISHLIDHCRTFDSGTVALEIEWNNKDPFYDRDLNNFRLLFDLRTIHVGVIVTRSDELQDIFDGLGRGDSYGASTTHMSKLLPRLEGGSGGGCPILVLGITRNLYVED